MYPSLQHIKRNGSEEMGKISHHVHSGGGENHAVGRGGHNVTERISRTKVEFKPGVQPKQSSGLHNVAHGFESAGRPRYMVPLCGSDRVLELTSNLLSSYHGGGRIEAEVMRTVRDSVT